MKVQTESENLKWSKWNFTIEEQIHRMLLLPFEIAREESNEVTK
jgi:hypothetical protein